MIASEGAMRLTCRSSHGACLPRSTKSSVSPNKADRAVARTVPEEPPTEERDERAVVAELHVSRGRDAGGDRGARAASVAVEIAVAPREQAAFERAARDETGRESRTIDPEKKAFERMGRASDVGAAVHDQPAPSPRRAPRASPPSFRTGVSTRSRARLGYGFAPRCALGSLGRSLPAPRSSIARAIGRSRRRSS